MENITIEQLVNNAIRSTEGGTTAQFKAASKVIAESEFSYSEKWKAWEGLTDWYNRKRQKEIERERQNGTIHQAEARGDLRGVEDEAPSQTQAQTEAQDQAQATQEDADRDNPSATPTVQQEALGTEGHEMDRRGMADVQAAEVPQGENQTEDHPEPQVQDEGDEAQGEMGTGPQGQDP